MNRKNNVNIFMHQTDLLSPLEKQLSEIEAWAFSHKDEMVRSTVLTLIETVNEQNQELHRILDSINELYKITEQS